MGSRKEKWNLITGMEFSLKEKNGSNNKMKKKDRLKKESRIVQLWVDQDGKRTKLIHCFGSTKMCIQNTQITKLNQNKDFQI